MEITEYPPSPEPTPELPTTGSSSVLPLAGIGVLLILGGVLLLGLRFARRQR